MRPRAPASATYDPLGDNAAAFSASTLGAFIADLEQLSGLDRFGFLEDARVVLATLHGAAQASAVRTVPDVRSGSVDRLE